MIKMPLGGKKQHTKYRYPAKKQDKGGSKQKSKQENRKKGRKYRVQQSQQDWNDIFYESEGKNNSNSYNNYSN